MTVWIRSLKINFESLKRSLNWILEKRFIITWISAGLIISLVLPGGLEITFELSWTDSVFSGYFEAILSFWQPKFRRKTYGSIEPILIIALIPREIIPKKIQNFDREISSQPRLALSLGNWGKSRSFASLFVWINSINLSRSLTLVFDCLKIYI